MRKVLLILMVIQVSLMFGAQFEIVSEAKENPIHMGLFDLDDIHKLDENGKMGALVIVNCGLEDVFFQNLYGKIYQNGTSGHYKVVLRERTQYFVIQKEGFANHKYFFPKPLKSGTVYEMTLDEENKMPEVVPVLITSNENDAEIYLNGDLIGEIIEGQFTENLPIGKQLLEIKKYGFVTKSEDLDLSLGNNIIKMNLEAAEKVPLTITSIPGNADVILNNEKVGVTPYNGKHFPWDYTLTIEKDLFYYDTSKFTLSSSENKKSLEVKLNPKSGLISVSTTPPMATVFIDDHVLGKTPLIDYRVISGSHTLRLELDSYQTIERNIIIQDGDEVQFTEEFIPNFSDVTIKCLSTDNAVLTLNGEEIGTLPYYNPKLMAGNYSLKISKDLWLPVQEQLLIPPNEKILKEYVLTQNFGTLKITAQQADIYLNQDKIGNDYVETTQKPGNYQITAKRDRHLDAGKEINLISGTEEIINLEPQARLGSISLLTVDKYNNNRAVDNANIYLNDKLAEKKTPALISLLYGDYDLKVTHPQFLDYQGKLTVTENKHQEITIPLETYAGSKQYHYDKLKRRAWISTGLTSLILGAAITSNIVANSYYDQYEKTTNPADALDYKDQTQTWRDIRDYTYYTASGVAIYSLYSWIRTALAKD